MFLQEQVDIDNAAADGKLPDCPDDRLFHEPHVAKRSAKRHRIDLFANPKDELLSFERICRGEPKENGIQRTDRDEGGLSPRHLEKAQALFENAVKGNPRIVRLDA